jgi:hypothetical protein
VIEYGIAVRSVSIEPSQAEMPIRGYLTLVATVSPEDATNRNVTWRSTEPGIVSVDERGRIHALAAGEATIEVTTEDGGKKAACTVVVIGEILFNVSIAGFPHFSGEVRVPHDRPFDNIRADVKGLDSGVIAVAGGGHVGDEMVIELPGGFASGELCKVARDSYNDYEGWWPASEVSDRSARVAGLGDIVAYSGDTPVGRLSLTDWDGTGDSTDKYFIYFHYSDRPFTLSGQNLTRPGQSPSFTYDASFDAGWGVYANVSLGGSRNLCTTAIPDGLPLRWRFERWP